METKLLLIRHAVTSWHGQSRVLGQNDVPLDDAGVAQAKALAQALSQIRLSRIVASPLARAFQTAALLGERVGSEVTPDPRLTDMLVGEWEGMTYEELAKRDDYRNFIRDPISTIIPGGETIEEARDRALAAIADAESGAGGALAIVTHSDIVRLLLCHYLGVEAGRFLRFRVAVASVSAVSLNGTQAKVLGVNWTPAIEDAIFSSIM